MQEYGGQPANEDIISHGDAAYGDQPVGGYPAQPAGGTPGGYGPQQAADGYPGQPGSYPGQPGSYPGQPGGGYPGGYPGQPGGGYPGQPGYGGYGGYGQPGYGGWGPPPPPPRRPSFMRYVAVAVAAAALGAGAVVGIGHVGSSSSNPASASGPTSGTPSIPTQQPQQPQQSQPAQVPIGGNGLGGSQQAVVSKVSAGLVIINTSLQYRAEQAAGTGMIINSDGLVLTNNHVIENATSVSATVVATGKTYSAKVLGYDQTGDIAAIQLQGASGLRTIPIGDSSKVKTGDSVIAMGNAEGGSQIVPAVGRIVALHQTITADDENGIDTSETLHDMIKTDADIISGDSGGALANTAAQVVGMNTAGNNAQFPQQQQATGFAIPIDTALSVVNQIVAGKASSTISIGYPPFIGVFLASSSSTNPQQQAQDQAQQQGASAFGPEQSCYNSDANLPVPTTIAPVNSGVLILGSICDSSASSAGMTGGDVITAVNGQPVSTFNQLHGAIVKFHPGDTVSLTWVNLSGHTATSTVRLTNAPPA